MDAKYNPGQRFQGKKWTKRRPEDFTRGLPNVAASRATDHFF